MKKIFISFFLLSSVAVANLMAKDQFAIGIVAGSPTVGLDVLIPAGPISVDVNLGWNGFAWNLGEVMYSSPANALYASVDILFWEQQITDQFGYFIGAGPKMNWVIGGSEKALSFGANIPLGITFEVMENLNLLAKVSPGIIYSLGNEKIAGALDISVGARYSL